METRARFGAVPRAVILLATLALLTALAAGAIAMGASTAPKLPPPFGAAVNGLIPAEGDVWPSGESTAPRAVRSGSPTCLDPQPSGAASRDQRRCT